MILNVTEEFAAANLTREALECGPFPDFDRVKVGGLNNGDTQNVDNNNVDCQNDDNNNVDSQILTIIMLAFKISTIKMLTVKLLTILMLSVQMSTIITSLLTAARHIKLFAMG